MKTLQITSAKGSLLKRQSVSNLFKIYPMKVTLRSQKQCQLFNLLDIAWIVFGNTHKIWVHIIFFSMSDFPNIYLILIEIALNLCISVGTTAI